MKRRICFVLAAGCLLLAFPAMARGWHLSSNGLKKSCLREAENTPETLSAWQHMIYGAPHNPAVDRMQKICIDMAAEQSSQDKEKHVALAKRCSDAIADESIINPRNTKHFTALKTLCEKMTGETISTGK